MSRRAMTWVGLAVSALLVATTGCGSSGHNSPAAAANVKAPPTTGTPPAGRPNTCVLLTRTMARSLAGQAVSNIGGDPYYAGPNVVCEYAAAVDAAHTVDVSLVGTKLQSNGTSDTPAQWDQVVRSLTRGGRVTRVASLNSPGYYGWSSGPDQVGAGANSSLRSICGFAHGGYGFFLAGRWSKGLEVPPESALVALCEQLKASREA